ncbi:MAG: 50S ribosomal protein L23 [Acidobacteria bacterium]|nr:50S ribosomal protein L23 [Acidobacteriota bacterium]
MKALTDIIRRPIITEKGVQIKDLQRTLVFEVAPQATKPEIKRAVEAMFNVKVEQVRTVLLPGKFRRRGLKGGYRADWKKAYVRLKPGEKMVEYLEPA